MNVTTIPQPPPGCTGATQWFVDVKSPEVVTDVTVRLPVPLLNTKTGLDVELPITSAVNRRELADNEI